MEKFVLEELCMLNRILHTPSQSPPQHLPKKLPPYDKMRRCEYLRTVSQESTYQLLPSHYTNLVIFLQSHHEEVFGLSNAKDIAASNHLHTTKSHGDQGDHSVGADPEKMGQQAEQFLLCSLSFQIRAPCSTEPVVINTRNLLSHTTSISLLTQSCTITSLHNTKTYSPLDC
jgi:hypothetical protein